jgi:hypothetical protein
MTSTLYITFILAKYFPLNDKVQTSAEASRNLLKSEPLKTRENLLEKFTDGYKHYNFISTMFTSSR